MTDIDELKARVQALEGAIIALAVGGTITIDTNGRPTGRFVQSLPREKDEGYTFIVGPMLNLGGRTG